MYQRPESMFDRNLSRAAELAPEDGVVRLHLSKLKLQKAKQAEKDRTTFAGMFARGSVCDQRCDSCSRSAPSASKTGIRVR